MIVCEICNINLSGPTDEAAHLAGRRHRQATRASTQQSTSQAPNNRNNPPNRLQNAASRRAQTTAQPRPATNSAQNSRPPRRNRQPGSFQPPRPSVHSGARSDTHQEPQAEQEPEPETQDNDAAEKHYAADFGVILQNQPGPHRCAFEVISAGLPEINFHRVKRSRRASVEGFQLSSLTLTSPNHYQVCIQFYPERVRAGVHVVLITFTTVVEGPESRKLKAIVGKPEDHDKLKPISPYKHKRRVDNDNWHRMTTHAGARPPRNADFRGLPFYDVPVDYRREFVKATKHPDKRLALEILLGSKLPIEDIVETYTERWKYLLWHEELQIEEELKAYDMTRATINHVSGNDFSLEVPGLLEKRPSVIITDMVAIRETGSGFGGPRYGSPSYSGFVTDVQMSKLILRLPHNFPQTSRPQWDVRFTVNRLLFRRMHDSVSKAGPHGRILFPSAVHPSGFRAGPQASLSLDRRIASNPRQSLAVKQIVSKSPGGVPFIIFGPPGTGKTTVLVESIRQVVDTQPNSRVLVCAPSNTATDLIATRLLDRYTPRQLVRLNAPARAYSGLPAALRNYSPAEGKTFNAPPADKLKEFRIVVTTCYYSSIPPALGVNEHFTHIFVDEAGHAAEPEIMIPILQNASRSTNIIISGDPMQLGPIVQSKTCIHFNMDVSFLERLAELSLYQIPAGEASNPHIVKLLQNYRSHPAILNYSNHVFYDNELEYRADPALTGSLLRFPELPTEGFPIIFHNICGENLREAKSPSFFNIEEATVVNHYVSKLLDDRRFRLEPSQIGVITPYRQQCSKIKKLLQAGRHGGVDVRVTEDWQGQERRVIIISAVRSDPELLEEGAAQFLGFVSSWRRTNVALTRAQALLIVIGNAPILELDPIWYFFMRFVHDSGGWAGPGDIADFILNPADQIFEKLGGVNKNYESFIAARREKLNWAAKAESLQT